MRCFLLIGLVCGLVSTDIEANDATKLEFFETKIRPVLVEHCTGCHNSFDKKKGGLALDYRQAMLDGGDSGDLIVPGKPEDSVLLWALQHKNGYEMPANAPQLDQSIIDDFTEWIRTGAYDPRLTKPEKDDLRSKRAWPDIRREREQWWSFQPVKKPAVPSVANAEWSTSPIDRFVFAEMDEAGLSPQPLADPATMIRRVHLILTGLPPTPKRTAEFLAAPSDAAYQKLVDELLDSPAFGERWARHWMDWYRYAETHGSEGDPPIPFASEYRDYLIRALNSDVPYDQLLKEHLAGDLLENPRLNRELQLNESAIGPAHLRMVPHGFGVTDAYGEQITFTDNQIDVISKAMLGVTVSCARCHNHKFDPISQKDFYRLFGVMISSRPSTVLIDTPAKLATNKDEITELKKSIRQNLSDHWLSEVDELPNRLKAIEKQLEKVDAVRDPLGLWAKLKDANPDEFSNRLAELNARQIQIEKQSATAIAQADIYIDLRDPNQVNQWFSSGNGTTSVVSPSGSFALQPNGTEVVRGIYPRGIYSHLISDKHAAVLSSANVVSKGKATWVRVAGEHARLRVPIRNYPLTHGGLHPETPIENLPSLSWQPTQRKWSYWLGEKVHYELRTSKDVIPRPGGSDRSWFGVTEIFAGENPPPALGASLLRVGDDVTSIEDQATLLQAYQAAIRKVVSKWKAEEITDAEAEFLDRFVRLGLVSNQLESLPTPLQNGVGRYRQLEAAIPVTRRAPGVLDAAPVSQPLLVRGNQSQEAEAVPHQFLEAFSEEPFSQDRPARLQLAESIVSPENPLTSRLLINRLWAYCFGRGIVSSVDNFGRLGSEPTHPELLDFLAVDFQENGWSIKRTLRKMVTSRAFRIANSAPPQTLERDPDNKWLSFYRPRRLDAEAIYDSIGQLAGDQRRAVQLPIVRNRLDPFLSVFNAPVPVSTVGARTHTDVPAQYLALMNGSRVENAANVWSQRIQKNDALSTPAEKITEMFHQVYARDPFAEELRLLEKYRNRRHHLESEAAVLVQQIGRQKTNLNSARKDWQQWVKPFRVSHEVTLNSADTVDLQPIASWDFENDATDSIGGLKGRLVGNARIENGSLVLNGGFLASEPLPKPLRAKTLEVLVQLDGLDQRGGGAMSVQTLDGSVFDSIVYAEAVPRRWLAGSDHFRRTIPLQGTPETDADREPVHIVLVYEADGTIRSYRNGETYAKPYRKTNLFDYSAGEFQVLFGLRHGTGPNASRLLTGRIEAARLYDRALTEDEVRVASKTIPGSGPTDADIFAGLTPSQQETWKAKRSTLDHLQDKLTQLEKQLVELRSSPLLRNDGYYAIAHALLNSKEFLYVP
ncbi:DUF1549 domain-containing protein [Thalassoroseus pseudoceratinae]|uniref:DUF1549 domain-containing protein n=1 Tax=Thalassoroseus pseudoceratinae TaxID=2713176 RepID=UPI00142013BD|nr:DUF1549 domain-containing protein [Thalassoroseus pseudoceratinae]